jgi:hypothetical protein
MKNFRERVEYVKNGRQCGYTSVDVPEEFIRAICSTERPVRVKVSCDGEAITIKYYDERAEKRKKWVAEMFAEYCRERHCTHAVHGRTTYVAVFEECSGEMYSGFSTAVRSDVYDWETGVAVAYAKAVGCIIPEYV